MSASDARGGTLVHLHLDRLDLQLNSSAGFHPVVGAIERLVLTGWRIEPLCPLSLLVCRVYVDPGMESRWKRQTQLIVANLWRCSRLLMLPASLRLIALLQERLVHLAILRESPKTMTGLDSGI